ncbi:hypothetical protein VTK73DRAFT_8682 [Phialemonium thermophilum]|uniref:Mid2 domain-containing protein n=1 Tax=Phialemonium thermophilum TaxID=223376 RepID=A0ABR3W6Y7_9PEZI
MWATTRDLAARAAEGIPTLTTTFTPAPSCTVDIYAFPDTDIACVAGSSAVPCLFNHLGPTTSSSACFPSGFSPSSAAYYSPGVCPVGYTAACSDVNGDGSDAETTATCCPEGYSCQTGSDWPWYSTDKCSRAYPASITVVITSSQPGVGLVTLTNSGAGVNAFGLEIRYHSSDFATAAPTSTSDQTSSSSSATLSTTSRTSEPSSNPRGGEGGLSSGVKAGIAVGVVAFVLLAFAGIFLFIWRARRRPRTAITPRDEPQPGASAAVEQTYGPSYPTKHGAEMWGGIPGGEHHVTPVEMGGNGVAELPANH